MAAAAATGLSITNPLVKYRALVATKQVLPDQAQLRLALHLQKLYDRLIDYEPQVEYSTRLDQISRAVGSRRITNASPDDYGPLSRPSSTWRTLFAAKERRDSLALTRRLTNHESAIHLNSPKGLMLHGEVGTGKSMLIDLFADCLPTRKKRRWHFSTFMLETLAKLEVLRRSRSSATNVASPVKMNGADDYSLLWLAKDMVETNPILFLDEFQMPDRVASKILTNLMTSFFHLGGVLIATSNRMPEELAKASGEDFPLPAPSRLDVFGWGRRHQRASGMFGSANEFAMFLEVLKARCEVWEMRGGKDYRRMESGGHAAPVKDGGAEIVEIEESEWQLDGHEDLQHSAGMAGWPIDAVNEAVAVEEEVRLPMHYVATSNEDEIEQKLASAVEQATGQTHLDDIPWTLSSMQVYGRTIPIPRSYNGITKWTFTELCKSTFGPADYITLASKYHTLILTDVPVLTWLMKNEARRFITLLDALYECRCKLYISAEAGPDDLFFPEKATAGKEGEENGDSVYSETISEVYQDATAPFRPNILSQNPNYAEPDAEPDYTHARLAGLLNADALEDDPPNKPRKPFGRSFGRTDAELERGPIDPDESRYSAPAHRPLDFGKTSRFTGEDERFAYKRAQSRLWEMTGARWWARSEPDWHRPLPVEVRRWERSLDDTAPRPSIPRDSFAPGTDMNDATMGTYVEDGTRDGRSFKQRPSVESNGSSHSPFRVSEEPPPKFSWTHIWGTMKWGAKAGAWGQGPEGLKDRGKEKR